MEEALRKAFEETTTNNVRAAIDYTKQTRKTVEKLEEKIKHLENLILTNNAKVEELTKQLAAVQAKLYVGGTDGGN